MLTGSATASSGRSDLERFLKKVPASELFPGADGYGPMMKNRPIATVRKNTKTIGHVFLNTGFSNSIGYSGKPIKILIAIDGNGLIAGARLVKHAEPIVLAGIPEREIKAFIDSYKSLDIPKIATASAPSQLPADIVSGATVTILIIDDSIRRASVKVARLLGLGGLKSKAAGAGTIVKSIKRTGSKIQNWEALLGEGAVRRLKLTVGDINAAFKKTGNSQAAARAEQGSADETFIDLYTASLSVPGIARSLIGEAEFKHLRKRLKPGQEAFLIMGNGRYSFKGSGYVRGGIFGRIRVIQNDSSVRFRDRGHKRLGDVVADGAPRFKEIGVFMTPKNTKFNPAEPWRLQLLVHRAVGPLKKVFVNFDLAYQLPAKYIRVEQRQQPLVNSTPDPAGVQFKDDGQTRNELWKRIWQQKSIEIGVLIFAICVLTIIFFFQDYLVVSALWTNRVRIGFLIFTLFWIGFYAQAQLSVVNVLVFANALLGKFQWEFFLMEPLIFILWCSVVASILFWGRGAYCGWLCPFGALQELLNKVARWFKVPQITLPWGLHERLWPIKYLIFLALLGLSVYSLTLAEHLAEVEPFKTAIVLHFYRSWPYVLFVVILLIAGLFIERFFCRYLCPLGAALAIPARISMFHWLKRYKNCGDPCHLCARDCMVQAIDPMGEINPNECLHCLNCQQMYYNENVCPVVINKLAKARKGKPADKPIPNMDDAKTLYRKPRRLGRARTFDD